MTLHEAIEGFTYPHFVRTIQDAPITIGTLSNFEEGNRRIPTEFLEAYIPHLKGKKKKV